jgi:DNA-binding response OmpR family regulator
MYVLLVDDEAELASALAERLQLRGIDADWVTGGDEALERAGAKCYDLAVLDIKMPKIGGLELKSRLQVICPQMKFIFLTGYGAEKDFNETAGPVGEACCLFKPVDIQMLIARMQDLLFERGGTDDRD